jgi:hypothetical protein
MKYFKFLLFLILPALLLTECTKKDAIPDQINDNVVLKSAVKTPDLNGAHFELNLLGKKDSWNTNEVDNPDRHTMFVPMNTEGWSIALRQPNNLALPALPGIRINMSQGPEFAVLDGTVFDGDPIDFQLGPGKYAVYVCSRAKPVATPPQIDGWLEVYDNIGQLWYYQNLGTVDATRKWVNATDLFMIDAEEAGALPFDPVKGEDQWIFDYMTWLDELTTWGDVAVDYSDLAYFWQLQNNGSKLIKVRFYPI